MKKTILVALVCSLAASLSACQEKILPQRGAVQTPSPEPSPSAPIAAPAALYFPDANFEELVRIEIGKASGDIFSADVETIKTLDLFHLGGDESRILDISGIESFISLCELDLSGHKIADLGKLAGLQNLQKLYLNENLITDVSPLKGLASLTDLRLSKNYISDISALAGLTKLESIELGENYYLSDISVMSNFKELTFAGLSYTNVSDISALGGLRRLSMLPITSDTPIWDFSPLSGILEEVIANRKTGFDGYTEDEIEKIARDMRTLHERDLEAGQFIQKSLAELVQPGMTDLEKEFAIYNFVADLITYDSTGYDGSSDLYNAFIKGRGICRHYALAFRVLCTAAGLECYTVTGPADNGSGPTEHVWNIVKIDGVYYQVDVTWADQEKINYDYLNRSTAAMYALGSRSSSWPENDKDCPRDSTEAEIRSLVPGYVRAE